MSHSVPHGNLSRLTRFVPLAALCTASVSQNSEASTQLRQSGRLTAEVRQLAASTGARYSAADPIGKTALEIRRMVATVEQLAAKPQKKNRNSSPRAGDSILPGTTEMCPQPGQLYFETDSILMNQGSGSVVMHVAGPGGMQVFTFASGSTQATLITALNSFTDATGVQAAQSEINSARVELRSVEANASSFVRVIQMNGLDPLVFTDPLSPNGAFSGEDIGRGELTWDLDCDGIIGSGDLVLMLGAWGSCSPGIYCSPDFNGNGLINIDDLVTLLNVWDSVS